MISDGTASHERRGLWASALGSLVVGCVGVLFSLLTDSQAILLDGLFNLAYFATALLTLKVASLLARGETRQFPMGYAFFEPLVNGFKGLLIFGVSALALVGAVEALFAGGRTIGIGLATVYGFFASAACWTTALVIRQNSEASDSPLVRADAASWMVNAAISSAVLLTFLTIFVLQGTRLKPVTPYVDPLLVILVVGVSLGVPIRMAWGALMEILNRTPSPELVAVLQQLVHEAVVELPVEEVFVRVVQPGRTRMVLAHVLLPPDFRPADLAQLDGVRRRVDGALRAHHPTTVVDVVFTTDRRWCELAS